MIPFKKIPLLSSISTKKGHRVSQSMSDGVDIYQRTYVCNIKINLLRILLKIKSDNHPLFSEELIFYGTFDFLTVCLGTLFRFHGN